MGRGDLFSGGHVSYVSVIGVFYDDIMINNS